MAMAPGTAASLGGRTSAEAVSLSYVIGLLFYNTAVHTRNTMVLVTMDRFVSNIRRNSGFAETARLRLCRVQRGRWLLKPLIYEEHVKASLEAAARISSGVDHLR